MRVRVAEIAVEIFRSIPSRGCDKCAPSKYREAFPPPLATPAPSTRAFHTREVLHPGKRRSENSGKCSRSRNIVYPFLHVLLRLLPVSSPIPFPSHFLRETTGCLRRICSNRLRVCFTRLPVAFVAGETKMLHFEDF